MRSMGTLEQERMIERVLQKVEGIDRPMKKSYDPYRKLESSEQPGQSLNCKGKMIVITQFPYLDSTVMMSKKTRVLEIIQYESFFSMHIVEVLMMIATVRKISSLKRLKSLFLSSFLFLQY